MGPLFGVVLVVALVWAAWHFSPRRRMIRNRAKGEMATGGSALGGGGIGGMGI